MATRHATDEAEIRHHIDRWTEAIHAMDLESVMSIYAPDIVSFDIEPPLHYEGTAAKRKAWVETFAKFQPPMGYEVRDLAVTVGGDVAFGHSLNRVSATLKSGKRADFWLRWTTCFRKIDGHWLIAHEQISVPVELASGRAALNLQP